MENRTPYGEMRSQFSEVLEDLDQRRNAVTAEVAGMVVGTMKDMEAADSLAEWQRLITLTGDDDGDILRLSAAAMSILIERAMKRGAGVKA